MLGFTALSEAPLSTLPAASNTVTGTLNATTPVATLSATATVAVTAVATVTAPTATLSGAATVAVAASATPTTPLATLSASGTIAITASATPTTPVATISATGTVTGEVATATAVTGGWVDPRLARKLMRQARDYHKALRDERDDRERRKTALFKTIEDTYARLTGEELPEDVEEIAAAIEAPTPRSDVADAIAVYAAVSRLGDGTAMDAAFEALDRALLAARMEADRRAEDTELLRLVDEMDAEAFAMIGQAVSLMPILAASAAQMVTMHADIRLRP